MRNLTNYFAVTGDKKSGQDETFDPAGGSNSKTYSPLKFDSSASITFKPKADAKIIVYAKSDGDSRTLNICGNTETIPNTLKSFEYSNLSANKEYTIKRDSGESWVYYVKVTETYSDSAQTYKISGTSNAEKGDVLVIDGESVTVGEGGSWSYERLSDNAPYTNGQVVNVTSDKYKDTTVKLTYDNSLSYTGSITLEEKVLEAIPDKSYGAADVSNGLPYFDEITGKKGDFKLENGGSFVFMLDEEKVITVEYKCDSSSGTANLKIVDYDSPDTVVAKGAATNGNWLDLVKKLPAGKYKLIAETTKGKNFQLNTSNSFVVTSTKSLVSKKEQNSDSYTKTALITYDNNLYLVSIIKKEDAENADGKKLYQTTSSGQELITDGTDTVYTSVVIGGKTYTARNCYSDASDDDYVFATLVVNDPIEAGTDSYKKLNDVVSTAKGKVTTSLK